ncbi:Golgin sub A member 7 [Coemansia nantahalensis]|nr:Golgin sub A member 7 [Coemansia nantahalensis]
MSVDDSSEHWSFENLTQSSDSGFPLLASPDGRKSPSFPLSLVLNSDLRGSTDNAGPPVRSLSNSSSRAAHLLRRQVGCRPDSQTSETLAEHQFLPPPTRLATSPAAVRTRLDMSASPTPVHGPGRASRTSGASNRAVFEQSRSPDRAMRPHGSPSQPPAAHVRLSGEAGRLGIAYRSCRSDDQLPGSPPLQLSASPQLSVQRRIRSEDLGGREPSVIALPESGVAYGASGPPPRRPDPQNHKSYGLPGALDVVGQPGGGQWRRARVERDYSQGDARRFTVAMPEQLRGRIDEQRFKRFVRRINALLAEAEGATLRNVVEGCLAFATLYLSTLILKPHFKRTAERISAFVASENKALFAPAGLVAVDPLQTAYMFLEVVVL